MSGQRPPAFWLPPGAAAAFFVPVVSAEADNEPLLSAKPSRLMDGQANGGRGLAGWMD